MIKEEDDHVEIEKTSRIFTLINQTHTKEDEITITMKSSS